MKVDRLKFTDVLQVERCPKIPRNVDMQPISVRIEKTGNCACDCRQEILSSANPCSASNAMDQMSSSRSYSIGDEQNDSDEETSVQIHPQYRQWGQRQQQPRLRVPLHMVKNPAKYRRHERGYEMWSGKLRAPEQY